MSWHPPRTRQESLDRAVRSMAPGSWQGRVAQAMPVEVRLTGQVESLDEETLDSLAFLKFEDDDAYSVTAADVLGGSATFPVTLRPIEESPILHWEGEPQPPTEYTVNYADQLITVALPDFVEEGDRLEVHYAYLDGAEPIAPPEPDWTLSLGSAAAWSSGMNGGHEYNTGGDNRWSDSSDASYTEFAGNYYGPGEPQFAGGAAANVVGNPTTLTIQRLFVRYRVAALGPNQRFPAHRLLWYPGVFMGFFDPPGVCPTTPTWVDVEIFGTSSDLAYLASNPSAFQLQLMAPSYPPAEVPSGVQRWRVFECHLIAFAE